MLVAAEEELVVIEDVTELKRAEEKLKQSEERHRSLFENTLDSIALMDKEGRFLTANPAMAESLGIPPEELIGKKLSDIISPEDVAKRRLEMGRRAIDTGQVQIFDETRNGRHFNNIFVPVKIPGKKETFQIIARDITERKKAEEERESLLKELEAKNTELERFAYTVSHDLRSPLVTIQGFTDMVQTDLAQNDLEKAKENLTFIDKAATKMDQLLSDTLQLSRIGRMVNPPEDVPFGEIVNLKEKGIIRIQWRN